MPIHLSKEGDYYYYQAGIGGKRYYFKKIGSKADENAYDKALLQLKAMMVSKKKYHV